MRSEAVSAALAAVIRDHHDAFAVELFGPAASGLVPERIQDLVTRGLVDPAKMGGIRIPGLRNDVDPYLYMRAVGNLVEEAGPPQREAMREWTAVQWGPLVDGWIDQQWQQAVLPLGGEVAVGAALAAGAPPGMSRAAQHAYGQARTRAGEYARGLGNSFAAEVEAEVWAGETIAVEVQPAVRAEALQTIRGETAAAVVDVRGPAQLARDLAARTQRWEHDWERIARTELQGVYNEGIVIDTLEAYGPDATVARLPESGACDSCRALLLDGDGVPIVFRIEELIANGTNVGKPQSAWQATIWPIHPRCRCDTIAVPPGTHVDKSGMIRRLQ